jgi:hypothetical protein
MAYMNADTKPKVGFRPYGQTNPYHASNLSGLGQNHPFDPWKLHGLGQVRPFDQDPGGWVLSGLGDVSAAQEAALQELVSSGILTGDEADNVRAGNHTIGDYTGGHDPTDQKSWYDLVGLARDLNQSLITLEQAAHDDPDVARAIGADLINKRQKYSDLVSQLIGYYVELTGAPAPSGLSGLGFAPIVVFVANAAIFLISAFAVFYALHDWSKSIDVNQIKAQAELIRANTGQPAPPTSGGGVSLPDIAKTAGSWLTSNWTWVAIPLLGMFAVEGIFGGRRR